MRGQPNGRSSATALGFEDCRARRDQIGQWPPPARPPRTGQPRVRQPRVRDPRAAAFVIARPVEIVERDVLRLASRVDRDEGPLAIGLTQEDDRVTDRPCDPDLAPAERDVLVASGRQRSDICPQRLVAGAGSAGYARRQSGS